MMECWEGAGTAEKKFFDAILCLFVDRPHLLRFLFDPLTPRLSAAPEEILAQAAGLCSSDYLLVRVALDIWSGSGRAHLHEVIDADMETFSAVLSAMTRLAA